MKSITLSIDENILQAGREYARAHNVSFNVLVRRLIEQTVAHNFRNMEIVAAAEKANCQFLFSEDINTGQTYRGVVALNPFPPSVSVKGNDLARK